MPIKRNEPVGLFEVRLLDRDRTRFTPEQIEQGTAAYVKWRSRMEGIGIGDSIEGASWVREWIAVAELEERMGQQEPEPKPVSYYSTASPIEWLNR